MMAIADDGNSGDSGGEGDGDGGGGCGGGGCSGGQGFGQCKQLRRRQKLTINYQKAKKWHEVKDRILAAAVSRGRRRNGNGYGVCQVIGGGQWAMAMAAMRAMALLMMADAKQ